MVVVYLAHHAGTDLDLGHRAEVFGLQQAVFAGVLLEHRMLAYNDGLHGMIAALDVVVATFEAIIYVAVAVVVLNAEPQHETGAF